MLHSLFSKAKAKQMTINGFPDFAAAMVDLSKVHTTEARSGYDYQVTVPVGGCLIVLQVRGGLGFDMRCGLWLLLLSWSGAQEQIRGLPGGLR